MIKTENRVRAPRVPKGESSKVTIANQGRQIRLLTDRIVELKSLLDAAQKLSDENYENGKAWKSECEQAEIKISQFRKKVEDLAGLNSYNNGYIARVKETDGR